MVPSFLAIQAFVFCFYYGWGEHGVKAILHLKHENSAVSEKIDLLQREVDMLNARIGYSNAYPWCKEKRAREELHMAYPDETIFLL